MKKVLAVIFTVAILTGVITVSSNKANGQEEYNSQHLMQGPQEYNGQPLTMFNQGPLIMFDNK